MQTLNLLICRLKVGGYLKRWCVDKCSSMPMQQLLHVHGKLMSITEAKGKINDPPPSFSWCVVCRHFSCFHCIQRLQSRTILEQHNKVILYSIGTTCGSTNSSSPCTSERSMLRIRFNCRFISIIEQGNTSQYRSLG